MSTNDHITTARIEADEHVPLIRITRDFKATPAQLFRAHTDPGLYAAWVGPHSVQTRIDYWDARSGGSWRFLNLRDGEEFAFRGCFHEVRPDRIVQTFTWEGMPDAVSLETMTFEDLGDGRTRLHAQSLVDSFEGRDAWLQSGMDVGVNEGYAKLDDLIASDAAALSPLPQRAPAKKYRAIAAEFDRRVRAVSDWDVPTPVKEWTARDIVDHLATWLPAVLSSAVQLEPGPPASEDPVGAWENLDRQVQAILDDPASMEIIHTNPNTGENPLPVIIDRIFTGDVFLHTWDLARATGQPDRLDPDMVHDAYEGMRAAEEFLRPTGQFGEQQPVPDDAPEQDSLFAFLGRDPRWSPPAS